MSSEGILRALSSLNLAVAAGVSVLVVLLLIQRQQKLLKFLIGAFYVLIGYCLVICWMVRSGLMDSTSLFLYTYYIAIFALGPIIYIYTGQILNRAIHPRSIILMFSPACLMLILVAAYHFGFPQRATAALSRYSPFPGQNEPIMYGAAAIAEFSFCAYFFLAGMRVQAAAQLCGRGRAVELRRFRILYFIGTATCLAVIAGHLADDQAVTMIASTANGVSILAYFLYIHKFPGIALRLQKKAGAFVLPASQTAEFRPMDMAARLGRLMTEKRIYRESTLTLPALSAMLGIQHHQLSKILNESLGTNFRSYINRYRLEEAKLLLVENSKMSILDIAFAVGFNSKSAFNSAFMKDMGFPPSDYRKKPP
jgi:AraC-like DNA-binding protein